jgi:hypothetical protein
MLAALAAVARQPEWRVAAAGGAAAHPAAGAAAPDGNARSAAREHQPCSGAGTAKPAGDGSSEDALVGHLLLELPEVLLTEGAPATCAFDATLGGGGAASWPDAPLLALYGEPGALQLLTGRGELALLRSLFLAHADVAPQPRQQEGKDSKAEQVWLLGPRGAVRLLRVLGLVAPACRDRGGRGVTEMEGLWAAWASRPPRLQRGTPRAPEPLTCHEFVELAGRVALLAFGWAARDVSRELAPPQPFGPQQYASDAKRLWAPPAAAGEQARRAALAASWLGAQAGGGAASGRGASPSRAQRSGFDTTTTMGGIAPLPDEPAQEAERARAKQAAAAADAEARAQRILRLSAQRLERIEARAGAAARREELQRCAGQLL